MYQHLYQEFLTQRQGIQHFACHSHHYWPDVCKQAMLDYWHDSAKYVDDKWDHIFSTKLPQTQQLIANALHLNDPSRIVFASNTHELLYRIYSTFPSNKKITVLTTDSEFYSFERQSLRLAQADDIELIKVPVEPFATFKQRFVDAAVEVNPDWVFFSQVFFNCGYVVDDLSALVKQLPKESLITIDGYHGFFAIPTDLAELESRVFYLAGSYKYAQGGEGACFAVVPDGDYAPKYTGWFAEFGELSQRKENEVAYANSGQQFAGATMDYCAIYRLHASLSLFAEQGLTVESIHQYIEQNQAVFKEKLWACNHPLLNQDNLMDEANSQGHFLTFKLAAEQVTSLAAYLKQHGIHTDYRGDRLRFGFALYHNAGEYDFSCLMGEG